LRWKIVGGLAFLLGVFMLYQKAYYESRDFYADNFELYQHEMTLIKLDQQSSSELAIAMKEMQESRYWEAVTHLENLKLQSPAATQIAEWYKILCMIGLDEKEEAIRLLNYYVEQEGFNFNRDKALTLLEAY